MRGLARGDYNIRTPDFFSNLLVSAATAGLTPRMFPLHLELLLSPFAIFGTTIFRWLIDREVVKVRRAEDGGGGG